MFIPAGNKKRDTIWPNTSGLGSLLHYTGDVLHEDSGRWVFVVDAFVICVGDFAGTIDEDTEVGTHAGIDHPDVGGDERDFFEG